MTASRALWSIAAVLLVAVVQADLPIHCLNTQVVGSWVFELGKATHKAGLRCGHKVPDTNADHFTKEGYTLEVVDKYQVNISDPNVAVDSKGNRGTWTMVYDEGFEVIIGGRIFFAFNKYVPKTPESLQKDDLEDYTSICTETLVGWFHDLDGQHWGCYHGKRTDADGSQVSHSGGGHHRHEEPILSPVPRFEEERGDTSLHRALNTPDPELMSNLLWEPDNSFIELVNKDETSTWTARAHKEFLGKRMDEMMNMLGYRRNAQSKYREARGHHRRHRHRRHKRQVHAGDHGLPAHLDWRNHHGHNYDSPVKNQGNCGSCFAMATISVAEARVRILSKLKDRTLLSSQAIVSCSIYNQGCEGGYPYLVGKHAQDFGLVPQGCMAYSGSDEECHLSAGRGCSDPANPRRYYATNYSYIGGYYGACNELDMMKEIYQRGPIMVAFDAPSSLFYYSGGVYTGASPPHEGPKLKFLHPWEKTNHAVVAVGWGEEHGVKYWIIKNTWGKTWGENGYFRIRRGTDECGIESMAVTMEMRLP